MAFFTRFLEWIKSLFWKEEMELTLVGLQNSGKTTFVNVIAVRVRCVCVQGGGRGATHLACCIVTDVDVTGILAIALPLHRWVFFAGQRSRVAIGNASHTQCDGVCNCESACLSLGRFGFLCFRRCRCVREVHGRMGWSAVRRVARVRVWSHHVFLSFSPPISHCVPSQARPNVEPRVCVGVGDSRNNQTSWHRHFGPSQCWKPSRLVGGGRSYAHR